MDKEKVLGETEPILEVLSRLNKRGQKENARIVKGRREREEKRRGKGRREKGREGTVGVKKKCGIRTQCIDSNNRYLNSVFLNKKGAILLTHVTIKQEWIRFQVQSNLGIVNVFTRMTPFLCCAPQVVSSSRQQSVCNSSRLCICTALQFKTRNL